MNKYNYETKILIGNSYNSVAFFTCIQKALNSIYRYQKHPTKQVGLFATNISTGQERLIYATTEGYVYAKRSQPNSWFYGKHVIPGSLITIVSDIQINECSENYLNAGDYIVLQNTSAGCNLLRSRITSIRNFKINHKYFSSGINMGTPVMTQEKFTIYKKKNLWLFMNPNKSV